MTNGSYERNIEERERHELQTLKRFLCIPPDFVSGFAAMEVFRELPSSAELSAFCKQDAPNRQFSDELRSILEVSAMTGLYWHRWDELRTLLLFRLKQVLQDFFKSHMDVAVGPPRPLVTGESYQELEDRLTSGLEAFTDGAPFTIQRFCEVLLNPRDRYPNLDKVALAFEKLLLVTSTIPPSPGPYPGVPSVPAPTPAKDADQKPLASPKRENVDIITSESKDVFVAADEHMADAESTELKERSMDVDAPQPAETIAAEEGSRENPSEVNDEPGQPVVDEANTSSVPPSELVNTSSEPPPDTVSAPMLVDIESKEDVVESST